MIDPLKWLIITTLIVTAIVFIISWQVDKGNIGITDYTNFDKGKKCGVFYVKLG